MQIKRVTIGGNREEINRQTGEHRPNLLESAKRSELIFTPERLMQKFFKGTAKEYETWLTKHKLHPSQVNYHDIKQKKELIKKLKTYTMRLLDEAKVDAMFTNELGNILVNKWLDTFDTLENHVFDLSDFDKVAFLKVADTFKARFTTNSPFAFLSIDTFNQQIKVIESHKVIFLSSEPLPMGNKRGTPLGQEPEKLYQQFFTSIGYKGKGELTEGLNHHRTSYKNFNFNLNIETRLLNDVIYEILEYDREKVQITFIFGAYSKKFYVESDIKGTPRTPAEMEALAIADGATSEIEKALHKERQGSIAVNKTSFEVKKRIEHPKTPIIQRQNTPSSPPLKKSQPLSKTLQAFEKEMLQKQKGYAELAKTKINEALEKRAQYLQEFHDFLKKGMGVSDALNKFGERYANNPYIKGIIETSIATELQLQALKDQGIEELHQTIHALKEKIQNLKTELDTKETEIASLQQNMESIIVAHTRQLNEIETNLSEFISEKEALQSTNQHQSELIEELEKLIAQYEKTLQEKNAIIEQTHQQKKVMMEGKMAHYREQIKQLKEENELTKSTIQLLKINNQQLLEQISYLQSSNQPPPKE